MAGVEHDELQLHAIVQCLSCGRRWDVDTALARLINPQANPVDADSLRASISAALPRLRCTGCGQRRAKWAEFDGDATGSETLQEAVACEVCDRVIPQARLDALPGATRCVACEALTETVVERSAAPCLCPRCGRKLCWRVRRVEEPVKYFLGCSRFPSCRYTEN
jgi:hypothetical protein